MIETAHAKLNLALHVRAREADGYHRLETLFAFCSDGDRVEMGDAQADTPSTPVAPALSRGPASPPPTEGSGAPHQVRGDRGETKTGREAADARSAPPPPDALTITGPFAAGLSAGPDNLVLRAAAAMTQAFGIAIPALRLTKTLPVAAGIGGGSADAAAAMRLLARANGIALDDPRLHAIAAGLGADVPACLVSRSVRGEGRGDALTPWANPFAGRPVLLANPRVACPTGPVFAAWDGVDRGPLTDDPAGWRNDLEAPAVALVPAIATLLAEMRALPGAALVRMSGSGATCFALFDDPAARDAAAEALTRAGHWTLATVIL